jgi:hypothetical protein
MTDSMLERVARHLDPEAFMFGGNPKPAIERARAILALMKTPTEAMLAAVDESSPSRAWVEGETPTGYFTEDIWQIMLSAALSEDIR